MEASKRGENERPDRSAGRKAGDHDGKDVEERPGQNYDSPYSQTKLNKHDEGGDNSKRPEHDNDGGREGRDPKDRSRYGQGDRSGKSSDPNDPYKYNVEREDEPRGQRDPKRSGAGVRQPRESGVRNDRSRSPTKMEGSKRSENERPDRSVGRKAGDRDGKDVEERPGQHYDSPYSQTKLNKHEDDPKSSTRLGEPQDAQGETASRGQRKPSHSPSGGARGKREGESSSRPDRSAGRKDGEERPGQKYDSPYSQTKPQQT